MRVLVIGELTVVDDDDRPVAVAGAKERLLLAVLAAASPGVVTVDRLVGLLWDDDPPTTARKSLQAHVVHLRSALEPGRPRGSPGRYVARRGDGYVLAVERDAVDAHRFCDLVTRGRAGLTTGDPHQVVQQLSESLGLWRGPPYADWPDAAFAVGERRRLEEVRAAAVAGLLQARLDLGHHADVVPELEQLVSDDPLREGWWSLLMLALYRDGRQADALTAARRARTVLAEQVGSDPGPGLREIEHAVLTQDPRLDLPTPRTPAAPLPSGDEPSPAGPTGRAPHLGCPWLGLAAYQPDDAALFHGRHRLVMQLLERLTGTPVLVVSGPSGAGKSSVVRAGLVPALAAGGLPGSQDWQPVVVTPGRDAVDALAGLAGELPPPGPVLLVCDQAEELWAEGSEPVETVAFLDALLELVGSGVVARCVMVVRGDLLAHLSEHAAMAEHAQNGLVLVPAMTDPELREVVQEPAAAAALRVEPELVDAVVADVVGRVGALPLLSTALVGTWERRRGDALTLAGYLQAGGVAGALVRTAESVLDELGPDGRETARRILVRLAGSDRSGVLVRRPVPLRELELGGEAGRLRREVVEAFVRRRLLSVDDERLEVAHEVFLTAWPRLAGWLADDEAGRVVRGHLAPAAMEWQRSGEPESELYRGARLAGALDWLDGPGADPTDLERRFLEASQREQDRISLVEKTRADGEATARVRTRRLALGLAVALVAAVATAGLAVGYQRDATARAEDAEEANVVADANRLAALSATVDSLEVSLLLAVQAVRLAQTSETEDALVVALTQHPRAVRAAGFDGRAQWAVLGSDGGTLVVGSGYESGVADTVVTFSVDPTSQPVTPEGVGFEVTPGLAAVSPSGGLYAVASPGRDLRGPLLKVYDTAGRLQRWRSGDDLVGEPLQLAFLPDGWLRAVVALDGRWHVVEMGPADERFTPTGLSGLLPAGGAPSVSAGPGGDPLLVWSSTQDGPTTVVDVAAGTSTPLDLGTLGGARPVVLPGLGYATVHEDGRLTVRDTVGSVVEVVDEPTQPVTDLVTSPDATWAATVGSSSEVIVWDIDRDGSWSRREVLRGHAAAVVAVELTADGRRLVTVDRDGDVIVWDMSAGAGFVETRPGLPGRWISNRPQTVVDGELLVAPTRPVSATVAGGQGPARDTLEVAATFLDPGSGRVVDEVPVGATLPGLALGSSVSVSPDGRRVAVTSGLRTAILDSATRDVLEEIELPPTGDVGVDGQELSAGLVLSSAWSPDGSELWLGASRGPYAGGFGGTDGALVVVETTSGRWETERVVPLGIAPLAIEVSPDGTVVGVMPAEPSTPKLVVLDAADLTVQRRLTPLREGDHLLDLSFSPDGRWLAAAGQLGAVHLWDATSWLPLGPAVPAHRDIVTQVEWSDDSSTVVSAGMDGAVALLDRERLVVRATPLPASTSARDGYTFVAPGIAGEVVTLAGQRPGRRYSLSIADWVSSACAVVGGRNLTRAEWARYERDRPWEPTCSDLG